MSLMERLRKSLGEAGPCLPYSTHPHVPTEKYGVETTAVSSAQPLGGDWSLLKSGRAGESGHRIDYFLHNLSDEACSQSESLAEMLPHASSSVV